jgi:hypothetical protein
MCNFSRITLAMAIPLPHNVYTPYKKIAPVAIFFAYVRKNYYLCSRFKLGGQGD